MVKTQAIALFQLRTNGLRHLVRADGRGVVAVGFEVVSDAPAFLDDSGDRLFESIAGFDLAQVPEHQHAAEDESCRIDLILAFVFGGAAVGRFEYCAPRTDVRAGGDA